MSVFSDDIRPLSDTEKPLEYNCQESSFNTKYTKTSTITALDKSYYYCRIKYPISSFKSFFGLDIDFNPFDDTKRCYFEHEYNHHKDVVFIRPFIVNLTKGSDTFDTVKDVEMIEGIALKGKARSEHLETLKKISNEREGYINGIQSGEITAPRYIPKIDDFLEQIDIEEIKEKLADCYKIILEDIDSAKVLQYDKMIERNYDEIVKRVVKPHLVKFLTAPNSIFDILMKPDLNLEEEKDNIIDFLCVKTRYLFLLDCISAFHRLAEHQIDQDAFIDNKMHGKECSLIPLHLLAMWEIIKYICSIFKEIYITLKSMDTKTVKFNQYQSSVYLEDSDSGPDMSEFFDDLNHHSSTYSYTYTKPKVTRFVPQPYTDFVEFDSSMKVDDAMDIDIDKLSELDRNSLLENTPGQFWNYKQYKQMVPSVKFEPIIRTREYVK